MKEIDERRSRSVVRRRLVSGAMFLVSLFAVVTSYNYFNAEAARTGFSSFTSLISSDGNSVITMWREFSLLLVDSLPFAGTVTLLSAIFVSISTIRLFLKTYGAKKSYEVRYA